MSESKTSAATGEFTLERSLPGTRYTSPAAFGEERERLFFREWFCGGREEEVPEPGDYSVLDVAGESVIVVRTREGDLRAHYNVCRHRGSQLKWEPAARAEGRTDLCPSGRAKGSFRCPYHSWTYGLDGNLRLAPFLPGSGEFRKEDFALHPVGIDTWGGFFFVNLTPAESAAGGYSLQDQLGEIPERVRRYPLAELRSAARVIYDVRANWKVIMENYNECYHCGPVHPELCEVVPAFARGGGADLDWEQGVPHKEGAFTFTFSGSSERTPFPELNDDERTRHKGELAYPNLLLSLSADHVAAFTLWPDAPDRTQVVCDWLFHPSELARADFDPSDAVEFWDLINRQDWAVCESVQRGMESRVFDFGYYAPMENLNLDIRRYMDSRIPGNDGNRRS